MGKDDVGRERDQFCRLFANLSVIGRSPVDVHPHVAAIDPAQFLQRLSKRGQPGLIVRIVLGYGQENTDEPHPRAWLAPAVTAPPRSDINSRRRIVRPPRLRTTPIKAEMEAITAVICV